MAKPWLTSNALIASIKRKISMPISQTLFQEQDILDFINEEMGISQIPSVLQFHEEYYVTEKVVPLEENRVAYPIPDRAIGMRLRDIFYLDDQGNRFEMTRVQEEDSAYFQSNVGSNETIHKFYLRGNDVVITPKPSGVPTGSLLMVYFIRPNQLVFDERAAIATNFAKQVEIVNASIADGDTITVNDVIFTAVASSPGAQEFEIGASSVITATNLVTAITTEDTYSASNGSPASQFVYIKYSKLNTDIITSNVAGFLISDLQGIEFSSIPDNIIDSSIVDFLQTKPGHKIRGISVQLSDDAVAGTIISFNEGEVPSDFEPGDYVCLENECIIPYLPPDLHTGLAERTSARILAAIGDKDGLASANEKIQEIEIRQGTLLDNRSEGTPAKVLARGSLLRSGKRRTSRRF